METRLASKPEGSEIGKWMLENNLTEYYSEQMNKDLREAATSKGNR